MEGLTCSLLLLTVALDSVVASNRFFMSAPKVFHIGVREKVLVQSSSVTKLHMEDERSNRVVSEIKTIHPLGDRPLQDVELMVEKTIWSELPPFKDQEPYLMLVAEEGGVRKMTRVLVSMNKGYIFIQTNQPIYKPSELVKYRVFSLDHAMRPLQENIEISVFNPSGNRLQLDSSMWSAVGGLHNGMLHLPDMAGLGTWKIQAHFEGDKQSAVTLEFQVEKFVLPSFEVTIHTEEPYILLESQTFSFTVKAKYSYGAQVKGSFHTWFRVEGVQGSERCLRVTQMIRGLEKTGSIVNGKGTVTLQAAELKEHLQKQGCNLTFLEQRGAELVMTVSVTEQSSETQEAEISLPIALQRYEVDFSRTRKYFIPGAQLEAKALLRLPDGSPAAGVPVELSVLQGTVPVEHETVVTDQEGAAFHLFTLPLSPPAEMAVRVQAGTTEKDQLVKRMSSPSQQYLHIHIPHEKIQVGKVLVVNFQVLPSTGPEVDLYYMILSHGVLVHQGSLGTASRKGIRNIQITHQMIPSLRLIGYYYNQHDVLISDSVWVDVVDECADKVKIQLHGSSPTPGGTMPLKVEVAGTARVALVAVDTAMYALNRRNKLTAKQVFSAMESYDLGCPYGGGQNPESIFTDAGLSFASSRPYSTKLHGHRCGSQASRRPRRSVDLRDDLMVLKANLSAELQQCCVQGFSAIPMRMSCEARARRVSQMDTEPQCADIFLKCCHKGEAARMRAAEDIGLGRTSSLLDIEQYFISNYASKIRRNFAPSFAFTYFDVTKEKSYTLSLPDSITTWEIQAVTMSATHGFCVVDPLKLTVRQDVFVSLRLPYSVRKYEQLSVVAVIYNYRQTDVQLAVHMAQVPGLCSPGSSSFAAFVNVTVGAESSKLVTFTAIPMVSGPIPIKIRLLKINGGTMDMDAIEKILNVWTEGQEQTKESTITLNLNGRRSLTIDGQLPSGTVPGSASGLFIKMEGAGFGQSSARNLLSADTVASLLRMPSGCTEQTMTGMAPTVLALRYLDQSQQWFQLPVGTRDKALKGTEKGLTRMMELKEDDGSYRLWRGTSGSYWLTAFVVKVLSLLADRQSAWVGQRGVMSRDVTNQDISNSVRYLRLVQRQDGSFSDPNPVIKRLMGGMEAVGMDVTNTAFITVALHHAIPFVDQSMKSDVAATITKATTYLLSQLKELKRPYAVAITAYCLARCLPDKEGAKPAWQQLQVLSTLDDNGCRMWKANPESRSQNDAITVETTAYALLTALLHQDFQWADNASCWLVAQENYQGGFKSTQDTVVALEALAEYDMRTPSEPFNNVEAEFYVTGRPGKVPATLRDPKERVEVQLKTMIGNKINVELTGRGKIKMKVQTRFHVMEPQERCALLNINVTVEGKIQYETRILSNYQYFDENYDYPDADFAPKGSSRRRRNADQSTISENSVKYTVCVSLNSNLTGMAIADITLLSGFEPNKDDLDLLKGLPELYISHYEVLNGRVILYFNEFKEQSQCVVFEAQQTVPISLLQPAPASFYDYYEPKTKCTVFYSAPKRTTEVSNLCSDDVCQCAERPCHQVTNLLKTNLKQGVRMQHACFDPVVDYGFVVEVDSVSFKSNFRLYNTTVLKVLKQTKDRTVAENSIRVFVNRLQCREKLELGKQYLIMGKDGATTDLHGKMQYLLESNTWVELAPEEQRCTRKFQKRCKSFNEFASSLLQCTL